MSKGTGAEAMAFAYFKRVETEVAQGSKRQRGWKTTGPGERKLATRLKNLGLILGNRKSFRKILKQPLRGSFEGAGPKEQDSCGKPSEIDKAKRPARRACTHPTNLKGKLLGSISSPFWNL